METVGEFLVRFAGLVGVLEQRPGRHGPRRAFLPSRGVYLTRTANRKECAVRVIGSVKVGGVEYTAVWASLSSIHDDPDGQNIVKALAVRSGEGKNETVVRRNAKLAVAEQALRHLRGLGLSDSQLGRLFNYKGDSGGLAKHVRGLVCNMT